MQTLPFRALTDNAIALHQLALVLSSALLALTTFVATRWACSATWPAFLAAAFAVLMPWRVTELSHLQLSSAHFFPLIWMGVLRGWRSDLSARSSALLALAIALQVLSSFYLAYYLSLSCGVLIALCCVRGLPPLHRLRRLALCAAPGYALLLLSAIPYLQRQAASELTAHYDPGFSIGLGAALANIRPSAAYWPGFEDAAVPLNAAANYGTPWAVLLLALVALSALRSSAAAPSPPRAEAPLRFVTLFLLAVVIASILMMVGGHLEVLGFEVPLPDTLVLLDPAGLLPSSRTDALGNFGDARAPDARGDRRGVSRPLGQAQLAVSRRAWGRRGEHPRLVSTSDEGSLGRFRSQQHARRTPPRARRGPRARAALDERARQRRAGLAQPPPKHPTLEAPSQRLHRPPPRDLPILQRIGERLPSATALQQLTRLTGLRFILVDASQLRRGERGKWNALARQGHLRSLHAAQDTLIFEVADLSQSGDLQGALLSRSAPPTTFSGLKREALSLPGAGAAGRLTASFGRDHLPRDFNPSQIEIRNESPLDWPGFDYHGEGLVQLRYTYRALDDAPARTTTRLARLNADFRRGESHRAAVLLQGPRFGGRYELCLDLVQEVGGLVQALPVAAVKKPVRVGHTQDTELSRMIARYFIEAPEPPPCGGSSQ